MGCFWTDLEGFAEQACGGGSDVVYLLEIRNSNFEGEWLLADDVASPAEPPAGFDMTADFTIESDEGTFVMFYQPDEARHQGEPWVGCDFDRKPITITQGGQSWAAFWTRGCS